MIDLGGRYGGVELCAGWRVASEVVLQSWRN